MKSGHRRRNQTAHGKRCPALTSALLLLVLLLSAQAQDPSSVDPPKLTVRGVVINSVTREPLGRALVFSPDNRLAALTDDQGHFEFVFPQTSPEPAATSPDEQTNGVARSSASFALSYVLTARKPGFLDPNGSSAQLPSFIGNELTLTLVPEALIIGRVVLPSSNQANHIQVDLYRRQVTEGRARWVPADSLTTRSNGDFRFANLAPGTYKLFTREQVDRDPLTFDPGGPIFAYPPVYFPNATDFESAASIQLTPAATFQAELSPVRQPYYPVKVPVSNASSEAQLMINVFVHGYRGPGFTLGFNPRSQKIEGSLPNGSYVIEATGVGPTPATGSSTLTVKGAAVEGPALTLSPLSSVRINARLDFKPDTDANAQPENITQNASGQAQWRRSNLNLRLERADEFLQDNDIAQLRPPTGPRDDTLVFENVAPGRYWVRIDSSRGFAASITAGDLDLLRRPLPVSPGANLTVDVTLRDDGAEINGSIEGMGSNASPTEESALASWIANTSAHVPAYVYCIPVADSTGQFREAPVMPDGKFNLQQVPPGAYRVLAFDRPQPELEYRNSEAMRAFDTKGQVIRLAAGQKEDLRLQIISSAE